MKNITRRTFALLLTAALLLLAVCSCSSRPSALLTLDHEGIRVSVSVNEYRFLLARLKGAFIGYGYTDENGANASQDSFWTLLDTYDGETLQSRDDYYRAAVLENARRYLVGLWLFEKNKLTLSDTAKENIQQELDDILADYGSGSKTRLNAVLSAYGVNYDLLREAFEIEAKCETVMNFLYGVDASGVGNNVKDQYLNAHYLRFRQIFFANYSYVYCTDANGDTVYYDKETGKILYDTVNGFPHTDTSGERLCDSDGQVIRYVSYDSGRIAYDKQNGTPAIDYDSSGTALTREMTEEERAVAETHAKDLAESAKEFSDSEFEAAILEENGQSTYTDGYYLLRGADFSSADGAETLTLIAEQLETMEVGQTALVVSSSGWHVIRRYAPTSGAYNDAANEAWFTTFADGLMEELFEKECQEYLGLIRMDDAVYATVPPIREIEANYYF